MLLGFFLPFHTYGFHHARYRRQSFAGAGNNFFPKTFQVYPRIVHAIEITRSSEIICLRRRCYPSKDRPSLIVTGYERREENE